MSFIVKNQTDLAKILGFTPAQVAFLRTSGMPGAKGNYDLTAIVPWILQRYGVRVGSGTTGRDAAAGSEEEEDQLTRKRRLEADRLQIRLDRERARIVYLEEFLPFISTIASKLKAMGERFEKQFGLDALDLLNSTLDEIQEDYTKFATIIDDSDSQSDVADGSQSECT